ncbi:hypothetical protein GGI24_005360, partial [Coemansia furcata]
MPKAAVKIGHHRVVLHVPSPAPVRIPGPEPPPLPGSVTELEPMDVDAPVIPPVYTKKDIEADHAHTMVGFAANLSDKALPANSSSEAIEALHAAIPANFDDILADLHVSNADAIALHAKGKADAHEAATMDCAEEAEEHNEDLEAAREVAKKVAKRGIHVAKYVAINTIDAKAHKAADIYAKLRHPGHTYIGGDPGKK